LLHWKTGLLINTQVLGPVVITMKKNLAGTWRNIGYWPIQINGNKFATGQILKKPVEVVEGRILAGWAQKSPEPCPETIERIGWMEVKKDERSDVMGGMEEGMQAPPQSVWPLGFAATLFLCLCLSLAIPKFLTYIIIESSSPLPHRNTVKTTFLQPNARSRLCLCGIWGRQHGSESGLEQDSGAQDSPLHALLRLRQFGLGGQVYAGLWRRLASHGCHGIADAHLLSFPFTCVLCLLLTL
jgi:hypothetical protein